MQIRREKNGFRQGLGLSNQYSVSDRDQDNPWNCVPKQSSSFLLQSVADLTKNLLSRRLEAIKLA